MVGAEIDLPSSVDDYDVKFARLRSFVLEGEGQFLIHFTFDFGKFLIRHLSLRGVVM